MVWLVIVLLLYSLLLTLVERRLDQKTEALKRQVSIMQARFDESGISTSDDLQTQVRVPEKWVDYEGIPDEDLPARTGVHISRDNEWLDHARLS